MKHIKNNSVVFIETYAFESGLWYLAKTLIHSLIEKECEIIIIPKARYVHDGGRFVKTYLSPENSKEFEEYNIVIPNNNQVNVKNLITKHQPDYYISFETLMKTSQSLYMLKRRLPRHAKLIDIPMVEWVQAEELKKGSYQVFDEIWCLTQQCAEIFQKYHPEKVVDSDFWKLTEDIFSIADKNDEIIFYHQASLNSAYSSKNTDLVIRAFDKFLQKVPDATLFITGNIKDQQLLNIIEKHTNISLLGMVRDRKTIADLMKVSNFLIAPSSREGLGLQLAEAQACGCQIITTNAPPMSEYQTPYLCSVSNFKKERGLIPLAIIEEKAILEQLLKAYNDWSTNEREGKN